VPRNVSRGSTPRSAEEIRLLRRLSARVKKRVMIDVGAHQETTLEPFVAGGFDVYAFEPIESNRARLRKRLGEPANLVLRPEAVGSEPGTAHRLDELAASGEIPSSAGVLRVETEGHDLAVLEGASALSCDVVIAAFWGPQHPLGPSASSVDQMVELMSGRGFGALIVVEHLRGATWFRFGSADQIDPGAWGRIVFFHRRVEELYEEIARWCRRGGARAPRALEDLLLRVFPGRNGLRFYDVGAFRGSFAVDILEMFPGSRGTLFEPSDENALAIEERLGHDPRIELRRVALSDAEGERTFTFFPDAPAIGSLLERLSPSPRRERRSIAATTIDRVWEQAGEVDLDLIKVDTQGEDLAVLKGAQRALSMQIPVLIVEAIFVRRYSGQSPPHELLAFAAEHGYRLVHLLNVNHTRAGELAWADFVLVHESVPTGESEPPFVRWDPDDAIRLRAELQAARKDLRAKRRKIQRLVRERNALRTRLNAK
jgi:FkbM family methyltransferase